MVSNFWFDFFIWKRNSFYSIVRGVFLKYESRCLIWYLIFHQVSEESRVLFAESVIYVSTEFFFTSGIIERVFVSLPLAIYIYRTLPLRLLHDLECFSRVTKRHRGQEMLVCVIRSLKWRFCPQLSLIFDFLSPIALFHHITRVLKP